MAAKIVKGEGPRTAKLVFVGECPGTTEIKLGRPFVGRAGKFLDKQLRMNKINRKKAYITNIVKVPCDGVPSPAEVRKYLPMLKRELSLLRKAKVIVLLGKTAAKYAPLNLRATYVELPHPSAAMRFTKQRKKFEQGMSILKKLL